MLEQPRFFLFIQHNHFPYVFCSILQIHSPAVFCSILQIYLVNFDILRQNFWAIYMIHLSNHEKTLSLAYPPPQE